MTTFHVTATRGTSSPVWVLQCVEHPGAISETKRLDQAADLMTEAIAFVAGTPAADVGVELVPVIDPEISRSLDTARTQQEQAQHLAAEAAGRMREAARALADEQHVSLRDIGVILGVSYQRAHQLANEGREQAQDAADVRAAQERGMETRPFDEVTAELGLD